MNTNILDFGAVADGSEVCTEKIQAAIDKCAATGGGRVTVPVGTYVSGTIWLRSNVELHLAHGANLIASRDLDDYNDNDAYEQNFFSINEQWNGKHLIIALECENVAITGHGVIDGSGDEFYGEIEPHRDFVWDKGIALAKDKEKLRLGQLVVFVECQHIKVTDVTIKNCSSWTMLFHGCDYVQVRGYKSFNLPYTANTDGIDIDSCSFVTMSDCIIEAGDDAIAVRCNPRKLKNNTKVCENVTITNCALSSYSSGIRIGVGNGYLRHLCVSNLSYKHASNLITFSVSYLGKSISHIEDVMLSNITCERTNRIVEINGEYGYVKNVVIDNIRANAAATMNLTAIGDCEVENFRVSNVVAHYKNKYDPMTSEQRKKRGDYLVYAKNVKGLELSNLKLTIEPGEEDTWKDNICVEDCPNAIVK